MLRRPMVVWVLLLLAASTHAQTVWHVDDDNCPGPGTGSWGDPFCKIQDGIDAATDQDYVLVRPGTYYERINLWGKKITVQSDTDGDPSTWDPALDTTIIDGGRDGSVVTFDSGEDNDSVLAGFTISNGKVDTSHGRNGGGIYCFGSSPVIRANKIIGNEAKQYGAGIYCSSASPQIIDNIIMANLIVYLDLSGSGGGICCFDSSPLIDGNWISHNRSDHGDGGGIYLAEDSNPVISNNTIKLNQAYSDGGGIACDESHLLQFWRIS